MKKLMSCIIVALLTCASAVNAESSYSEIVVFGDSLSDPGNVFVLSGENSVRPFNTSGIPDAPYARGGHHFSNGETWVEQLSKELKLKGGTGPALRSPAFTNYAFGGARARATGVMDLTTQVGYFLSTQPDSLPADTLFSIYVGGNDVRDALVAYLQTLQATGDMSQAEDAANLVIGEAVAAIFQNMTLLTTDAGAGHFLVPNAPNVGVAPSVTALGSDAAALATALSAGFNAALNSALDTLQAVFSVEIVRVDIFGLITNVVAAPGDYGLQNATDSCITPDVRKGAFCTKPDDYLFWDGIHPTRAGHALLANSAAEALSQ